MKNREGNEIKLKSLQDLSSFRKKNMTGIKRNRKSEEINIKDFQNQKIEAVYNEMPIFEPRKFLEPRIFKIIRSSSMKLSGFRYDFQIYYQDKPLYHAKVKPYNKINQIGIMEGTESHISSKKFEAVLLYSTSFTSFSLRKESEFGDELMRFSFKKFNKERPRTLSVSFVRHPPSVPNEMHSIEPESTLKMRWMVDLNSDHVITSIKNCRLEDEAHNYLVIRKVQKDCLEVETTLNITIIYIFAIAIGSFLFR